MDADAPRVFSSLPSPMDGGDAPQGQSHLRVIFFRGEYPIARRPRRSERPERAPDFFLWLAARDREGPPAAAADPDQQRAKRARVAAASEEAILGLPEVAGRSREGEDCAVCLNDFRADETLRAMPCSHAFHHDCIAQWLRRKAVCPLCRHQLLPDTPTTPEEEEDAGGGEPEPQEDGGGRAFASFLADWS